MHFPKNCPVFSHDFIILFIFDSGSVNLTWMRTISGLKELISVTSCDPLCKDGNTGFTMVPVRPVYDQ